MWLKHRMEKLTHIHSARRPQQTLVIIACVCVCVRCTLLPKAIGENRFEFAQTNWIGMKSSKNWILCAPNPKQPANNTKLINSSLRSIIGLFNKKKIEKHTHTHQYHFGSNTTRNYTSQHHFTMSCCIDLSLAILENGVVVFIHKIHVHCFNFYYIVLQCVKNQSQRW